MTKYLIRIDVVPIARSGRFQTNTGFYRIQFFSIYLILNWE